MGMILWPLIDGKERELIQENIEFSTVVKHKDFYTGENEIENNHYEIARET
jgi:hypothetical protein